MRKRPSLDDENDLLVKKAIYVLNAMNYDVFSTKDLLKIINLIDYINDENGKDEIIKIQVNALYNKLAKKYGGIK